jgi:hypothetical protein
MTILNPENYIIRTLNINAPENPPSGYSMIYATASGWFSKDENGNIEALNSRQFLVGLLSSQPPAGTANRFYFATDTNALYFDNGSAWSIVQADMLKSVYDGNADGTVNAADVATNITGYDTADPLTFYGLDGDGNPGFQDFSGVVVASQVGNTPAGGISSTNVQDALDELDDDKLSVGATASEIVNTPEGGITSSNVQDALNELDTDKANTTQALDTFGATTDVTTNNANTLKHGLMPKLSGLGDQFLSGDGTYREISDISVVDSLAVEDLTAGVVHSDADGELTSSKVAAADLDTTGTADNTAFLRGDMAWVDGILGHAIKNGATLLTQRGNIVVGTGLQATDDAENNATIIEALGEGGTPIGDMTTTTYDGDMDGIVEDADKVHGINSAGVDKLYGTNADGTPGFYDIPVSWSRDGTNVARKKGVNVTGTAGTLTEGTGGSIGIAIDAYGEIQNSSTPVTKRAKLDVVGGVFADDAVNGKTQLTLPYNTIQDEGTARTQRQVLNFIGDGVSAVDNSGEARTDVTIQRYDDGWIPVTGTWTYSSTGAHSPIYVVSVNADMTGVISVGMKIKLTHATVKYFIVTAIGAYGAGVTLITVYGGSTPYTVAGAAITLPHYSTMKAPFGFPTSPLLWSVIVTDVTERSQASPTSYRYYNLGAITISVPIGLWRLGYSLSARIVDTTATAIAIATTLSTVNDDSTASNPEFTVLTQINMPSGNLIYAGVHKCTNTIASAAKTTWYILTAPWGVTVNTIYNQNAASTLVITAECAYL